MDGKQFAYYLMRHPHLAAAVKHLVVAEASYERDGKHFPYREAGGSAEDEAIAEAITETAQLIARKEALAREEGRTR